MAKPKKVKQTKELRTVLQGSKLEARESNDGKQKQLRGYAVVFNSPANIGDFSEIVAPGAVTRTLREDDQVMLRDHQSELLLGRRSAGTLKLTADDLGLAFVLDVPNTALGQDTYENVRLGNLLGCSFGFQVRKDNWKQDADGNLTRILEDVQIFETTLTAFPAYGDTSVDLRSVRAKLRKSKLDDLNLDPEDDDDLDVDDGDDNDDDEDSDECRCFCRSCSEDDDCSLCDDPDCTDENCGGDEDDESCPQQTRAAHLDLLMRRLRS